VCPDVEAWRFSHVVPPIAFDIVSLGIGKQGF